MKCPKCNGKSIYDFDNNIFIGPYCDFCRGKTDLDWIENILGVDPWVIIWGQKQLKVPVGKILKNEMSKM